MSYVRERFVLETSDGQREALRVVEREFDRLRSSPDPERLERVRSEATTLASASNRRVRKKAERIAREAATALAGLQQHDPAETREERETRLVREARWEAQQGREKLRDRLVALLHLLLIDENSEAVAGLESLATTDENGYLKIEIPEIFDMSAPLLVDGFERSHRIFQGDGRGASEAERLQVERGLKALAVELMTAGAEVRNLAQDATPLIAYGLLSGHLTAAQAVTPERVERVNDLLLGVADEVASLTFTTRLVFLGLYRLVVLLGEAQAFADQWSVPRLSSS